MNSAVASVGREVHHHQQTTEMGELQNTANAATSSMNDAFNTTSNNCSNGLQSNQRQNIVSCELLPSSASSYHRPSHRTSPTNVMFLSQTRQLYQVDEESRQISAIGNAGMSLEYEEQKQKRRRITSPTESPSNGCSDHHDHRHNNQQSKQPHFVPLSLLLPILILAQLCTPTMASPTTKPYLTKVAPSRPTSAPDVDYGGLHPFDEFRHLYDVEFVGKKRVGSINRDNRLRSNRDDRVEGNIVIEGGGVGTHNRNDRQLKKTNKRDKQLPMKDDARLKNYDGQQQQPHIGSAESQRKNEEEQSDSHHTFQQSSQTSSQTTSQTATTTTTSSSTFQTTTLNPAKDSQYQPLRIAFDTSHLRSQLQLVLSAGDTIAASKLYLLIYEILPMTAEVWGDILRVIPVVGGIYPLDAVGGSVDVLLPNDDGGSNGGGGNGGEETTCTGKKCRGYYEDPVRLLYCPDKTTAGIGGGADLLIYATVNRHCGGDTFSTTNSGGRKMEEEEEEDGDDTTGSGRNKRRNNNNKAKAGDGAMGTLASALSCQRDQYDRPITGSIDFCLGGMGNVTPINVAKAIAAKESSQGSSSGGEYKGVASEKWDGWYGGKDGERRTVDETSVSRQTGDDDSVYTDAELAMEENRSTVQYSVGVAVHEIAHVLGVTSDSLAFFRHPVTGYPLTPRPFTLSSITCVSGEEMTYVGMPGSNVMKAGVNKGTGSKYFEVVTPTVKRVVANQFNCPNITGARLENQPTSNDCFGSHWDERLFYTEIMGAVFSQTVNILSPLTLALLEDSGWYRANYQSEYIQISMFGHGAGCGFIEESCIDSNGNVPPEMEGQFCNTAVSIGSSGSIIPSESGSQTCDPSHTRKTYCDLVDTNQLVGIGNTATLLEAPPTKFQYFEGKQSLRPYVFTSADYCPIPHLDPQSCAQYNGRPLLEEQLEAGEYYGSDSRCVETDGSRSYSLCLQTKCNARLGLVEIFAGSEKRTCEYDGQVHTVLYNYDGDGPLRIKCPQAALVCPDLYCPANCAGRGTCIFRPKDVITTSEPLAKCVCDSDEDTTDGCYNTNLTFPASYGYRYENPEESNKTLFLVIVGSLVAGLAVIFVVVRQWKMRQNVFL